MSLTNICKLAEKIHMTIMNIALSIMVLAITYQVISRYFLNYSLVWAEELARSSFIWMILLGLSYVVRNDEPIKITAVRDLMPPKVRTGINALVDFIALIYACIYTFFGIQRVIFVYNSGQISPGLQISMVWIIVAIPVGFFLVAFAYLLRIYSRIVNRADPDKGRMKEAQ